MLSLFIAGIIGVIVGVIIGVVGTILYVDNMFYNAWINR